jgi:large subunit ribosomal protein L29
MADRVSATELRKLTAKQLADRLDDAKAELFNLRFQLATNQLDNTARLTHVKKDVARILTVMRQQEIEAWEASVDHGETAVGRRQTAEDQTAEDQTAEDETADGRRQTAAEPSPTVEAEEVAVADTVEAAGDKPAAEPEEKKRRIRRGR